MVGLEVGLGHRFGDPDLLRDATTHRSWCAENGGTSNERLEFLGDAVLGMVIADQLFRDHPDLSEGHLAMIRAAVVSAPALAEVARGIRLGDSIRFGHGESTSGGSDKESILADALEAVIAAVHLDGGPEAAGSLVRRLFGDRLVLAAVDPGIQDYKTRLQELAARAFLALRCSGMARVDFFLADDGRMLVNEVNTIPGFTSISMYPRSWLKAGLSYGGLIDQLVDLAVERHARRRRNTTR